MTGGPNITVAGRDADVIPTLTREDNHPQRLVPHLPDTRRKDTRMTIRHTRTLDLLEGATAREIREAITHHIPDEYVLGNDHTVLEFAAPGPDRITVTQIARVLSEYQQVVDNNNGDALEIMAAAQVLVETLGAAVKGVAR